jgi:DNA-binding NarL/FixJ family response regulator
MNNVRLLLADDHTLMLQGIRRILEEDFELAGTVSDGRALVAAAQELRPDVILMDISMPLLNGIDAAKQIRQLLPETKLIFLTMHKDRDYVTEAFRAGASGYILKWSAEEELTAAIRRVLAGKTYLTPLLPQTWLNVQQRQLTHPHAPACDLSSREREVLQLIAEGMSAKQIAATLNVSNKTVEFHKYRIMRKLGIHNVAQLTKYAVEHGLTIP